VDPGAAPSTSSWPPPSGWTGGISGGSTALLTTFRRRSSSVSGGSRRGPKLPEVGDLPAPPSGRLGGEMGSVGAGQGRRIRPPTGGQLTPRSGTHQKDLPLSLPWSARGQGCRANPTRRVSGKPGAIQSRSGLEFPYASDMTLLMGVL